MEPLFIKAICCAVAIVCLILALLLWQFRK